MIEVYTDGAYSSLRNQGGWAFVVSKDKVRIAKGFGSSLNTTNNRMEIQAAIKALEYAKENNISELILYTDSMYVINTMTQGWKRKKNVDLWLILDDLVLNRKIDWKHVKGHNGDPNNEYCDTLAVHGSNIIVNNEENG